MCNKLYWRCVWAPLDVLGPETKPLEKQHVSRHVCVSSIKWFSFSKQSESQHCQVESSINPASVKMACASGPASQFHRFHYSWKCAGPDPRELIKSSGGAQRSNTERFSCTGGMHLHSLEGLELKTDVKKEASCLDFTSDRRKRWNKEPASCFHPATFKK